MNGAIFFSLIDCISVNYRFLDISQRNFLAFDKDRCELPPLSLVKFPPLLVLRCLKNFFSKVHD